MWKPKLASEYSDAEKIKDFDDLHKMALEHYKKVKKYHYADENTKSYFFEAVLELLGRDVWKRYNKLIG